MTARGVLAAAGCLAALLLPDAPPKSPEPPPYVLVLGTAQDGGLPQIGGTSAQDEGARRDPARRRLVASLLVADRASGGRCDATVRCGSRMNFAPSTGYVIRSVLASATSQERCSTRP